MEEAAMMPSNTQEFCLRWNNFHSSLVSALDSFKNDLDFVDVTLACEGQYLKAHKMLLSACSVFFKDLLKANPCPHPIIILPPEVRFIDLEKMLRFIYQGEVNVHQENLARFLKTAEMLKIRGLADDSDKQNVLHSSSPKPSDTSGTERGRDSTSVSPKRPRLSLDTQSCSMNEPTLLLNDDNSRLSGADSDSEMIPVKQEMIELKDCDFENVESDTFLPNSLNDIPASSASNDIISLPVAPPPPGPLLPSYVPPPHIKASDDCILLDNNQENRSNGRADMVTAGESWRALSGQVKYEKEFFEDDLLKFEFDCDTTNDRITKKDTVLSSLPKRLPELSSVVRRFGGSNFLKSQEKSCPICGRIISSRSNLRKHINRAHGKPTCSCFVCGKSYKATCDLRRHLLSSHNFRMDPHNTNFDPPMMNVKLNTGINLELNDRSSHTSNSSSAIPFSALLAEDPSFEQNFPEGDPV